MRCHAAPPLPIFIHWCGACLGPPLLPLIVRLTAPLPDRLEQTYRLLRAQFPLRCRLLSGRRLVILRGLLRLLRALVLRLGWSGLLLLTLVWVWGWRLLGRSIPRLALLLLAILLGLLLLLLRLPLLRVLLLLLLLQFVQQQ